MQEEGGATWIHLQVREGVVLRGTQVPGEHGCTYDYKEEGREMITLKNPVVKGEKLKDRC
ncbi:hypothetical protein SAY86_010683 [Trapa natans]|uniref:Uncharacterized protein n=1 Tax=Trapa natans TaxID=22666 RepID=A0AAN7LSN7_TRANT|nr:hypothetical protein SAY86_010683 [Trapa natans]